MSRLPPINNDEVPSSVSAKVWLFIRSKTKTCVRGIIESNGFWRTPWHRLCKKATDAKRQSKADFPMAGQKGIFEFLDFVL
jgi:hypothetical protein